MCAEAKAGRWGLAVTLAALIFVPGAGQDAPGSAPDHEFDPPIERLRHTERHDVRLVQVPAVVTNRRGRVVRGLEPADFLLLEDHVPQKIRYLSTEPEQPLSIAFLLDISGSMRQTGKLDEAKEAIRVFANELNPRDRLGLVCFADEQVDWITNFTADRQRFVRRLGVQRAYGQTALLDALAAAPGLVDAGDAGSKAIVLFTDGVDTSSKLNTWEALGKARRVNVPIFAIGFATFASRLLPAGSTPREHRIVGLFAEETGGRLFIVHDPDDLKEAILEIQNELRFRYVISYRPQRTRWDGTFRRIRLETIDGGLTVRARSGYYAEP
jgi:Ca-activated chloride channel family protein